ncbi:restriction endonuclease subunit S [Xanthobacteraceae bacterium Astr-EGSB]|uniref:restriction endonuclease subunit S n=1 Tax=Astrobacterium formosum TaxID=3069710 RepID=UPI0027B45C92|nr:restriction endonuclease subunit S [Xanthobacteraceae bacterium Astr-EGSB]
MADDWEVISLGRLVDADRGISYGIVQPGAAVNAGVPIVRVGDIRNARIATADPLKVSPEIEAAYSRTRLKGGELLLTLVGTVGEAAIVPSSLAGWNTARAVAVIPVRKEIGSYWVQLALRSPAVKERIGSRVNTTVQTTLNLRDVSQLPIVLPPEGERVAIAHILGTLDDKIELNRRMNETLEAMARALFKSWFVDFDPVRAKAEGRDPDLAHSTAELFPADFEESELGAIPAGWTVGPILEQAQLLSGGTPKTDRRDYWDGGIPWASAKDVSQCPDCFLIETERTITEKGLEESATQLIPAYATAVVARGATTGRLALLGQEMAMNQTCYALATTTGTPFALYCHLCIRMNALVHAAHGSVFDTITTSTFKVGRFVLAPQKALTAAEKILAPVFMRMLAASEQSRTLAALRDTLLPKLISGELRVKAAEKIVEAVA